MKSLVSTTKDIQRHVGVVADGKFGPLTAAAVWRELNKGSVDVEDAGHGEGTKEEGEDLDERTMKNIGTLDAKVRGNFIEFARLAKATAATLGCDYVMISGNRTYAEQTALYAKGRTTAGDIVTNARAGFSNHNFGIAGDFGVFRGGAYLDNSDPKMAEKVHKACSLQAKGCGLEWGGSWRGFKDIPHYEFPSGLSMSQKRKAMAAKGSVV